MLRVELRVQGRLDAHWSSWFSGLALAYTAQGETVLTGEVADQAALYGLLARARDLGLALRSVHSVTVEKESEGTSHE